MTRHTGRDTAAQRTEESGSLESPKAVVVTEAVSVGSSGRLWRLPFTGTLARHGTKPNEGPISITVPLEAVVIRQTCEFLRENAPELYSKLWRLARSEYPVTTKFPETCRLAREVVHPQQRGSMIFDATEGACSGNTDRRPDPIPSPLPLPKIDEKHWVYRRHHEPGHYITARSGERAALARSEVESDVKSIKHYISKYEELALEVKGKTLWRATHEPGFRDPYISCMELCLEMRVPSHFLALVHYGIGLQLIHELSFPWERKIWRSETHRAFHNTLKDCFRKLAALYRDDFSEALPA